jgi:glycosyltransferase involved in cell wall biosynthesis
LVAAGLCRVRHMASGSPAEAVFPPSRTESLDLRSAAYDRPLAEVLLVSPDRVAPNMAGPGIRYVELARVLRHVHHVRLAAPLGSEAVQRGGPGVELYHPERPGALRRLFSAGQVVFAPPLPPDVICGVTADHRTWIVDLYNAEPFEGLAHRRIRPDGVRDRLRQLARIDRLAFAARAGAAFVCASERQRDMWLGFLAASRRLDSGHSLRDPEFRRLIDVVPFGLPSTQPERRGERVRGTMFPQDARIMVWNGGLWDWFDPEIVLKALLLLREQDSSWHLVFSGIGRPSHRGRMGTSERVLRLVDEFGLRRQRAVHTREWTPYTERTSQLLDADMGVSAHRASLEARFAHRARMLDLVWTRTPILCTQGDEWSDAVVAEGLGEAVPPGDADALADAALRIAHRGRVSYRPALDAAASVRTWDVVAAPLFGLVETATAGARRRPDLVRRGLALRHAAASAARRTVRYRRARLARE